MSAKRASAREIGVGVIGLGLMGRVHIDAYRAASSAGQPCRLVAVFDRDAKRLTGRAGASGNLPHDPKAGPLFDPAKVEACKDVERLLANQDVELVSICTPTDTHVELALQAISAGKHVLVEKPVSLDAGEIERLDLVAKRARRLCMPAMCMRWWPGWSWLKSAIDDKRFGGVISAVFQRGASRPSWGQEFYADSKRSGGALFDLHIHDADFVRWLFGDPTSVASTGSLDHVTTLYRFAKGPRHVTAEGGWDHTGGFPFRMRYVVVFERATAEFDLRREKPLEIARDGKIEHAALEPGTGYDNEVRHALACVREERESSELTLADSAAVVRLLHAEKHALGESDAPGTASRIQ